MVKSNLKNKKQKSKNVLTKSESNVFKTKSVKSSFKYSGLKSTRKDSLIKQKNPLRNYNLSVVKSRCLRCLHLPATHLERQKRFWLCFANRKIELQNKNSEKVEFCDKFVDRKTSSKIGEKIFSDVSIDVVVLKAAASKTTTKTENPFYPEGKINLKKIILADCVLIKPVKQNCLICAWGNKKIVLRDKQNRGCAAGLHRKENNISTTGCDNFLGYLSVGEYYARINTKKT